MPVYVCMSVCVGRWMCLWSFGIEYFIQYATFFFVDELVAAVLLLFLDSFYRGAALLYMLPEEKRFISLYGLANCCRSDVVSAISPCGTTTSKKK